MCSFLFVCLYIMRVTSHLSLFLCYRKYCIDTKHRRSFPSYPLLPSSPFLMCYWCCFFDVAAYKNYIEIKYLFPITYFVSLHAIIYNFIIMCFIVPYVPMHFHVVNAVWGCFVLYANVLVVVVGYLICCGVYGW